MQTLLLPLLLAVSVSLGPQAGDMQAATTIRSLFHDFLAASDETVPAEAAQKLYASHGLFTIAEVGDEPSYEFVVMLASGRLPASFRAGLAGPVRTAMTTGTIPRDGGEYFGARLRLQSVRDAAESRGPSNPSLRDEIKRLFVADQAVRQRDGFDAQKMQSTDRKNEASVRAILSTYRVPTYDLVGPEASDDFIALLQHQPPDLRQEVLAPLRAAVDADEADPQNYAMVFDAFRRDRGEPQFYGERLECTPTQALHVADMEDAAGVGSRRASLGLLREEIYVRLVIETSPQICAQPKQ